MANVVWKIGGTPVDPPVGWQNIEVQMTFGAKSTDATLSLNEIKLNGLGARIVTDHHNNGGAFEGLTYSYESAGVLIEYMINLEKFRQIDETTVSVELTKLNNSDLLFRKADSLTFLLLKEKGIITNSDYVDVRYVYEKPFNFLEFAVLSITTYLMAQQVIDLSRSVATTVANIAGEIVGGLTGILGSIVIAFGSIILNIIYAIIMIILLKQMAEKLIASLFGVVKKHRGIVWRTLLEKGFAHLGYTFVSTGFPALDYVYLPSKIDDGKPLSFSGAQQPGIPRDTDFGYRLGEALELALRACTGEIQITGNVIRMEPRNSPYWVTTATFPYPDVLEVEKEYNAGELVANLLISFVTDPEDTWTTTDYTGTTVSITTEVLNPTNPDNVTLGGVEEILLPVARASRKNGLSTVELAVKNFAQTVDGLIGIFGGNSNLAGLIQNRIGMMRMSTQFNTVPKIIPLTNGYIPANHKQLWGALALWDLYINERSFVSNNFGNQMRVFKDIKIGLGNEGFGSIVGNKRTIDTQGRSREFHSVSWNIGRNHGIASTSYPEVFTTKLKETISEG